MKKGGTLFTMREYQISRYLNLSCKFKRFHLFAFIGATQTCGTFLRLLETLSIFTQNRPLGTGRLFCYLSKAGRPIRTTDDRIRNMTMNAMPQTAEQSEILHTCSIIVDDAQDFSPAFLDAGQGGTLISESMIPQVRTVATMIAAERHDFSSTSPAEFTDAADFFAARILVLGVRCFHLDVSLSQVLKTANNRARRFAEKHHLFFTPAQAELSLNKCKNSHLLTVETEIKAENKGSLVANSIEFARRLKLLPL